MVADVKPRKVSTDAVPAEAGGPMSDDGLVTPRPTIDPRFRQLARLASRWPHIEAELVRRRALWRRR